MNIRYCILARRQTFSVEENIASLIDIIEELTFRGPGVPENKMISAPFDGIFTALLDAEDEVERTQVYTASYWIDTPKIVTQKQPVTVQFNGKPRTRLVIQLKTFPLTESGIYSFCLQLDSLFCKWNVDVKIINEPS
jgi:hypothetical protein